MRYTHYDMLPYEAFKPIGKSMALHGKADTPPSPDYTGAANATAAAKWATSK